jgi:AcrR family transcriptional regulator
MTTTTDWLGDERQELAVERILEAASEVFARDGIQDARMGKIAEAAGCARATLYRYFPNKKALLHAYMDHVARQFDGILRSKLDGLGSLAERLVEAVAVSVELIQERDDVAPFFSEAGFGLTAQLTSSATTLRERLARQIDNESCSSVIRGELRRDITPDEAAEWLMRVILSFTLLPVQQRSGPELRSYLQKLLGPSLVAE